MVEQSFRERKKITKNNNKNKIKRYVSCVYQCNEEIMQVSRTLQLEDIEDDLLTFKRTLAFDLIDCFKCNHKSPLI